MATQGLQEVGGSHDLSLSGPSPLVHRTPEVLTGALPVRSIAVLTLMAEE